MGSKRIGAGHMEGDNVTTKLDALTHPKSASDYKATTWHLKAGYASHLLG